MLYVNYASIKKFLIQKKKNGGGNLNGNFMEEMQMVNKYTKRCSPSLVIRKIQIKITMKTLHSVKLTKNKSGNIK